MTRRASRLNGEEDKHLREEAQTVVVGTVGRPYGVRGWLHIHSDMDPRDELASHRTWWLRSARGNSAWRTIGVAEVRAHGRGLTARFDGIVDRDAATAFTGWEIGLDRETLPRTEENEFYWVDLLGASVVTGQGQDLGTLESFIETGANDVMVVGGERERLIPFVMGAVVTEVDLAARRVTVDWDPED